MQSRSVFPQEFTVQCRFWTNTRSLLKETGRWDVLKGRVAPLFNDQTHNSAFWQIQFQICMAPVQRTGKKLFMIPGICQFHDATHDHQLIGEMHPVRRPPRCPLHSTARADWILEGPAVSGGDGGILGAFRDVCRGRDRPHTLQPAAGSTSNRSTEILGARAARDFAGASAPHSQATHASIKGLGCFVGLGNI